MKHNNKFRRRFFPLFLLIIIPLMLFVGWIVMLLWNYVLPGATGATEITYLQGLALLVLSRILFGFPRGGWGGRKGGPNREKWAQMSDEERIKFKEEWRRRCGWKQQPAEPVEKRDDMPQAD